MNLRRDVVTQYGTYVRGCPMRIIERLGDRYIVAAGIDNEALMAFPIDAFEWNPKERTG